MSTALYLYTIKAAIRDRMVRVLMILFILISALSAFLGGAAIFEEHSFTLIFAASSIRLAGVLGIMLFVSFYVQRSFASKDVDFILSRPISRETYIISLGLAFTTISVFLAIGAFLSIFVLAGFQIKLGFLCWAFGILVEIALMANIAMFFSMVLKSSIASFAASFGFYVLSRMSGALFGTVETTQDIPIFKALGMLMEGISIALPRLDLIVQSEWLLYGIGDDFSAFVYSAVVGVLFSGFILLASIIDLKRKEF